MIDTDENLEKLSEEELDEKIQDASQKDRYRIFNGKRWSC